MTIRMFSCPIDVLCRLAAVAIVVCTATLSGISTSPAVADSTKFAVPGDPILVYTRLARGMRRCWFGNGGIFQEQYLFRATVPPPGTSTEAKIGIYTKNSKGRLGRFVVQIGLKQYGEETQIDIVSRTFPEEAEQVLYSRLKDWARRKSFSFPEVCGGPNETVLLLAGKTDAASESARSGARPPLPRRTRIK